MIDEARIFEPEGSGVVMNEEKKSLKERLANLRGVKQASQKEAKVRVASAWTLAKSLLPTAPTEIQYKLAASLLANGTQAIMAALKQTAINAHYTKVAEKFEQMHKVELNEFLEDESFLRKMKKEIESELKGEAKNANKKTAAPEDEPIDDQPMNDDMPSADNAEELPPADDNTEELPPVDDVPPADDMPPAGGDANGVIPDAKKEELFEKIDALEADIQSLEEAVEGEEELDFSKIFDEGDMEDKTDSLANEDADIDADLGVEGEEGEDGEFDIEADGGASFFTDAEALEGELDGGTKTTEMNYFASASQYDASGLDSLLTDRKVASDDKIVERGEMAKSLMNEAGSPDAEEDHEDVILYEVLSTIKEEQYNPGEKRHTEPKLEAPKKSSKNAPPSAKTASRGSDGKPIRSLGNVKVATSKEQSMLASLVFPDEE